jgi:sugar phosphate isomerase/epimerase
MEPAYEIGVQSVVFQDYDLPELVGELEGTDIENLELWGYHLAPSDQGEVIGEAEDLLVGAGIDVCGYGVVDLEETGEAAEHFAFADRLEAGYVTVNYPPDRDDITEELIDLADSYEIDVGIHNYSTVHHDDLSQVFSSIEDVREVLDRYEHSRLGVCADTGHFLVMDERPSDVLEELGPRVNAVHLKDTSEAEEEDLPGAGELELARFFELLAEHTDLEHPAVIEYELEGDVTAALEEAEANVRAAMERTRTQ